MFLNNKLPILFLCILLNSCYESTTISDGRTDLFTDPIADNQSEDLNILEDVPLDIPETRGLMFIVRNTSRSTLYFSVHGYTGVYPESARYEFSVYDSTGNVLEIQMPWCVVECGTFTDPDYCCIDCVPGPEMQAVRVLNPMESFGYWWDEVYYITTTIPCPCGCYYDASAQNGEYRVEICASPDIICFDPGFCEPDENGFISGASLSDIMICKQTRFLLPQDSGRSVFIEF